MKVHCHLCGAALRRADQFHEIARPDRDDVIYVCRDEKRCETRTIFDPPSAPHGKVHSDGIASFPRKAPRAK